MSPMADAPELVLNRHTGKIAEWKMYDSNYSSDIERPMPTMILQSADRENYGENQSFVYQFLYGKESIAEILCVLYARHIVTHFAQ